jgi:deoxyxylulose-5-phosphate synthase
MLQENLTLVQVKSIKTRRKPSSEIPRRFFNDIDLARKNEKNSGITPAMPSGSSLKFMMDALPERAFDVELLNSTLLRCQLEWRPRYGCFATSTPLQRGMTR